MKELSINELLADLESPSMPNDFDMTQTGIPTPHDANTCDKSLVFLTDKVLASDDAIDLLDAYSIPPIAIVTTRSKLVLNSPCPIIRVNNVRLALSYALSRAYDINYEKIKFIGVTGSNGKTTTAMLIYQILKLCGFRVGFIGTGKILSCDIPLTDDTYSMTTPDPTVLYPALKKMTDDGCEYVVMEVSSHSLALDKVTPISFEYAIFTNLDNEHLDFHKTKDEYFKAKLKLFDKAKKGLFNIDDDYGRIAAESMKCQRSTFGILERGDAFATDVNLKSLSKTSFFYRESDLIFKAQTNLGGAFNVYNTLAAIKCTIDLGIKPCIVKSALSKIKGIDGRMELIEGKKTVVIDYAHTPNAFYNCLKTIKSILNAKQRLIIVFGCGGDRDRGKRSVFGKYAELFADEIVITEDNSRTELFSDIVSDITSGISTKSFSVIKKREDAIRHAFKIAHNGDVIALIGKGHERYKIEGNEYFPFDERAIIEKIKGESECE